MHEILIGEFFSLHVKEVHPWKLWREEERENIKLRSTVVNWVSQDFHPIPFPFSGKAYCLQG